MSDEQAKALIGEMWDKVNGMNATLDNINASLDQMRAETDALRELTATIKANREGSATRTRCPHCGRKTWVKPNGVILHHASRPFPFATKYCQMSGKRLDSR